MYSYDWTYEIIRKLKSQREDIADAEGCEPDDITWTQWLDEEDDKRGTARTAFVRVEINGYAFRAGLNNHHADNLLTLSDWTEPPKLSKKEQGLLELETDCPKIVEMSKRRSADQLFNWESVRKSNTPTVVLEKLAVYLTVTDNGPDCDATKLGRKLRQIRKYCGTPGRPGDILDAYEWDELLAAVKLAGLLGRRGDDLRDDGDKYW